jgi:hypothetical protein
VGLVDKAGHRVCRAGGRDRGGNETNVVRGRPKRPMMAVKWGTLVRLNSDHATEQLWRDAALAVVSSALVSGVGHPPHRREPCQMGCSQCLDHAEASEPRSVGEPKASPPVDDSLRTETCALRAAGSRAPARQGRRRRAEPELVDRPDDGLHPAGRNGRGGPGHRLRLPQRTGPHGDGVAGCAGGSSGRSGRPRTGVR